MKIYSQKIEKLIEEINSNMERLLRICSEKTWNNESSTFKISKETFHKLKKTWESLKKDGFYFLKENKEIGCLVPDNFTFDVMEGKFIKDGEFYNTMENSSLLEINIPLIKPTQPRE